MEDGVGAGEVGSGVGVSETRLIVYAVVSAPIDPRCEEDQIKP